jgi:hypothetical protein
VGFMVAAWLYQSISIVLISQPNEHMMICRDLIALHLISGHYPQNKLLRYRYIDR